MNHLGPVHLGILACLVLGFLFLLELTVPARSPQRFWHPRRARNLLLGGIGMLATHLVPGGTLVAVAIWGRTEGLGLLRGVPSAIALPLSVAGLDFALWSQHRASHAWPWFWRLHAVHHGDQAMDVTTAFRFHPVELMLSMGWKATGILLLGATPASVGTFEALLLAGNLFEHANLRLPESLDRALRGLIVTPRLHLVHHSTRRVERDSNFGFFLSVWDRAFGSLKPPCSTDPELGLGEERNRRFLELLLQPFEPAIESRSGRMKA